MSPATRSCSAIASSRAGKKKAGRCCTFWRTIPPRRSSFRTKLAMRFVSDNPPPALVDRMAQTFLKKDGDIREVLKTMFHSPEFWAPDSYRAKVKTPLEFVVSAVRASGAEVSDAMPLARQLQNMGMPLYGMQPPTGYSDESRRLGKFVRAAGTHELCAGSDGGKTERRAGGLRCNLFASECSRPLDPQAACWPCWRTACLPAMCPANARHDRRADERSEKDQASVKSDDQSPARYERDRGPAAGIAGVSEKVGRQSLVVQSSVVS